MAAGGSILKLGEQERGIVIFHLWQGLAYGARMALSFGLILAGLVVQLLTAIAEGYELLTALGGAVLILAGNLFLLVKGYDNRVEQRYLDPTVQWEQVGMEKLRELVSLDKQLQTWDRSLMDITNRTGLLAFLIVAGGLGAAMLLAPDILKLLALDAALLLLPHWLTGTRRLLRMPKLMVKAEAILAVLETAAPELEGWDLDVLMELKGKGGGKGTQLPQDIKFRLMLKPGITGEGGADQGRADQGRGDAADDRAAQEQAPDDQAHQAPDDQAPDDQGSAAATPGPGDFLGFYGQCSTNDVQGVSYPYFYTVLVAKKGYGLKELFDSYKKPRGIYADYDEQDEVETFVIRQSTRKKQGYHTNPVEAMTVFQEGMGQARLAVAATTPAA